MNRSLEEEVKEKKLCATLASIQNGKIPRPNRFIVEFFKSFYDLLKDDLLMMMRES